MPAIDEEDFTLEALVNRLKQERRTVALSKMDDRFYEHFDETLRDLRDQYTREHAANPATPKVLILQDELSNLQRVRDDLYDLRERKIVTAAIIAARGGNPDRKSLTKEEDILFEEFLRVLRDARRNLLRRGQPKEMPVAPPTRAPSGPPTPLEPVPAHAVAQPAAMLAEQAPATSSAPETPLPGAPAPPAPAPVRAPEEVVAAASEEPRRLGPARVLVRVKEPVSPFVGTDLRTYRLSVEDVAAVPRDIAHALVSRGLATALGG